MLLVLLAIQLTTINIDGPCDPVIHHGWLSVDQGFNCTSKVRHLCLTNADPSLERTDRATEPDRPPTSKLDRNADIPSTAFLLGQGQLCRQQVQHRLREGAEIRHLSHRCNGNLSVAMGDERGFQTDTGPSCSQSITPRQCGLSCTVDRREHVCTTIERHIP